MSPGPRSAGDEPAAATVEESGGEVGADGNGVGSGQRVPQHHAAVVGREHGSQADVVTVDDGVGAGREIAPAADRREPAPFGVDGEAG